MASTSPSRFRSAAALPDTPPEPTSVVDAVERALADASAPLPLATLRQLCRARTKTVCDALASLRRAGRIVKLAGGYALAER